MGKSVIARERGDGLCSALACLTYDGGRLGGFDGEAVRFHGGACAGCFGFAVFALDLGGVRMLVGVGGEVGK